MMTRNRHNSASQTVANFSIPRVAPSGHVDHPTIPTSSAYAVTQAENGAGSSAQGQLPTIRFIPYQDPRSGRPSLVFPVVSRILPSCDSVLRVGRYSERDNIPETVPHGPSAAPVGFKSKVVSRRHCEFWCSNSQWYIKDVKSSSGTFLNHIRLSQPGVESRPWPVNDGDVVQLGIDFKGGDEMIYRCVKIRLECNRGWQKSLNTFNKTTHKRLKNLAKSAAQTDGDSASTHTSECSICLMSVAPCQSLFVAPCSHVWHYKCIRPILSGPGWPSFLCPNCRAVADLEAEVDEPFDYAEWEEEIQLQKHLEASLEDQINHTVNGASRDIMESGQSNGLSPATGQNATGAAAAAPQSSGALAGPPPPPNGVALANGSTEDEHDATLDFSPVISHTIPIRSRGNADVASKRENLRSQAQSSGNTTPESPHQYFLAQEPVSVDGPMTPRNNAGPFVFDGAAGRDHGTRRISSEPATTSSVRE